jgi:hypothetical protein
MKKSDKEVKNILAFIRDGLARIKHQGDQTLSQFARENELSPKNLSNFLSYDGTSEPSFTVTYKILRGLLGRPPVSLPGPVRYFSPDQLAAELPEEYHSQAALLDLALLGRCDQAVSRFLGDLRLPVPPARRGRFLALVYESCITEHQTPERLNLKAIFLLTR